jgi:O-acetylhomoserine (thiol)-lyase
VHGTEEAHPYRATVPAIVESTAFSHDSAESMQAVFNHEQDGYAYSRLANPTVAALEDRITALSEGRGTIAVASGMSAIALALLGIVRSGDHIVAGKHVFGGTFTLLETTLPRLGVTTTWVDARDGDAVERALTATTRAVLVEAIANPAMVVPDFERLGAICQAAGIPLIVDATLVTPLRLDIDATHTDVAVYSGSKFLAGAATTIGGLIVDTGRFPWSSAGTRVDLGDFKRQGAAGFLQRIRRELMVGIGPSLSPHVAFQQTMGLETLGLRLGRQCESALRIAQWLREQPGVTAVQFPGLADHPDHARCIRSFGGTAGSVLSFTLASQATCFRFLNALRLVVRASNLGDTRTLALHPASTIYHSLWPAQREDLGVPDTLIRLSVGIEDVADILSDLAAGVAAS